MAKFDRRSCRIYDGVRDSKIHWDVISDFDRKIDSSNYGRVFPRSFKGDDFTEYNNKGFHNQSFLDSFMQHCEEDEDPFHGFNHKCSGTISSNEEIESWFCDYMKKEAPFLGVYRPNTESESIIIRFKRNLPVFDGFWQSEDLLSWIDAIEDFFEETDPPEKVKCNIVWYKMKGRAYYWWKLLQDDRKSAGDEEISSWALMKKLIISRFAPNTCSTKCPKEKESPKQSEDSSPSDRSHCLDVILETPIDETVEEIKYIREPENCEENNNDDDLDESFVEQQSEKIVKLKPTACSTKVRLESDIETLEKTTSPLLMPTNGPVPIVSLSVITSVGFSKALNIYDHMGNELFYEFGRVGCKHFDPGGICQDRMLWFPLTKLSHGPVEIVEMEKQEEIVMPEGSDPYSMGLEHIAFDISHERLHIEAQGVTAELKFRVEHEDTNTIRAMNIGPHLLSVKLPDSKTLMLGSLAISLIGIRNFILADEMLTLSFDPGGITKSGVLCPSRAHACRTNYALPRICDWNFDPGGKRQCGLRMSSQVQVLLHVGLLHSPGTLVISKGGTKLRMEENSLPSDFHNFDTKNLIEKSGKHGLDKAEEYVWPYVAERCKLVAVGAVRDELDRFWEWLHWLTAMVVILFDPRTIGSVVMRDEVVYRGVQVHTPLDSLVNEVLETAGSIHSMLMDRLQLLEPEVVDDNTQLFGVSVMLNPFQVLISNLLPKYRIVIAEMLLFMFDPGGDCRRIRFLSGIACILWSYFVSNCGNLFKNDVSPKFSLYIHATLGEACEITGVMVLVLTFGMRVSSNCWYVEPKQIGKLNVSLLCLNEKCMVFIFYPGGGWGVSELNNFCFLLVQLYLKRVQKLISPLQRGFSMVGDKDGLDLFAMHHSAIQHVDFGHFVHVSNVIQASLLRIVRYTNIATEGFLALLMHLRYTVRKHDKTRDSAHAFITFDPGGVTACHSFLDIERLIIIALKEFKLTKVRFIGTNLKNDPCATPWNVRPLCCVSYMSLYNFNFTRGRVKLLEGWNDVNNSSMGIMIECNIALVSSYLSSLCENGQYMELKLFHKTVNGLDPPIDLDSACTAVMASVWTLESSLVDELFVWGDGLM